MSATLPTAQDGPRTLGNAVNRSPAEAATPHAAGVAPRPSGDGAEQRAVRLLSQTAHDLRAPLCTIHEAVRLVRDGDLGRVSAEQREFLNAAIEQCDGVTRLVEGLVQAGRLESGLPQVQRKWIPLDEVRRRVDATLRPWSLPRGIRVLWDGPFGQQQRIFGDPVLLWRLIVNLVGNAIRVTPEGQPILIRAQACPGRPAMQWTVVDQGDGITLADLERLAQNSPVISDGTGLGLTISRQIAAAHFSSLEIESRVGTGTAVSFQTCLGGPAAVAENWSRWRQSLITCQEATGGAPKRQVRELIPHARPAGSAKASARPDALVAPQPVRIDIPTHRVELSPQPVAPLHPDHVHLATLTLPPETPSTVADQWDQMLGRQLRLTDLAYRSAACRWVLAWDADQATAERKRASLAKLADRQFGLTDLRWDHATTLSLPSAAATDRLANQLRERLVRQTLSSAAQPAGAGEESSSLSAQPDQPPTAEQRLTDQLAWIADRSRSR